MSITKIKKFKIMPKTKRAPIYYKLRLAALVLALAGLVGGAAVAHADQFDDQINALSAQNASAAGLLNGLESQAGSYQGVINQLQTQIDTVQAQIASSQAQQTQLEQQIATDQQQITLKKGQ